MLGSGERLGPYRLVAVLGEGLVGVVFRAVREPSGETVALKVLREEFAEEELYRRRFQREARIARQVVHKNIVPVLDFGEDSGHLYLASRFVPGCSLSERIAAQGRLSVAEVFRLASEMGRALDALHKRGLVHRDVKPANVMIDKDGAAALTDFGLARAIADTVLTRTGAVVGTVDYLAPELIRGERANSSSDLYSMGCLLYECLAGTPPFAGRSFVDTLIAHVKDNPRALYALRGDVPESLDWAVMRALAKDPADRPGTASAYARIVRASTEAG